MYRRVACAALAALGFSFAAAQAADLPRKAPIATPAFTWTGFYVGVQGAIQWGRDQTREFLTATGAPTGFAPTFNTHGGFGGLHAGYNYQIDRYVVGIEGDVEFGRSGGSFTCCATIFAFDGHNNWQASARGRLGLMLPRVGLKPLDHALVYVTGGAAFTELKYSWTSTFPGVASQYANFTKTGWTLGGGAELPVTDHVTMRIEYRYSDFGKPSFDWPALGATYVERPRFNTVRAGISYKF